MTNNSLKLAEKYLRETFEQEPTAEEMNTLADLLDSVRREEVELWDSKHQRSEAMHGFEWAIKRTEEIEIKRDRTNADFEAFKERFYLRDR